MRTLFAPAEALMNRLNYPLKFGLIGLLVLLAFANLMWSLTGELQRTIERSRNELVATALTRPLAKVVELTQQHRGLSSMLLSGNTAVQGRRSEHEADVERAMAALRAELSEEKRRLTQWQQIESDWAALRRDGLQRSRAENFDAHTLLIARLLKFQIQLADAYGLSFDPDEASFYLMTAATNRLPLLLERFGRLRARGAGVLAQGSADNAQRVAIIVLNEEIKGAMAEVDDGLNKVAERRPELRSQLQQAVAAMHAKIAAVEQVVNGMVLRDDFQSTSSAQFFDMTTAGIAIGYAQMYDVLLPTLDQLLEQRMAAAQQVLYFNLALALLVMAVIGYLSMGAYLSVMTSIRCLREGSEKLAGGDLSSHIQLQAHDELRFVAGGFNSMAETMRGLIGGIKNNSSQVADSARDLVAASGQINVASQKQSDAASSMAAAVEEMTVGIEHIARGAGDADALALRSGELSREGGAIVASVVQEISEIAVSVAESARTIEELGERSGQISTIVGVIGDIAAQTNLLALNAAIEAARAGEQGRGFAVVADEVRNLAARTANSTREISEMVQSIQQGTQGAVAGMEKGVERVGAGVARAKKAGEAMSRIREAAEQVQATVAEISNALREQSSVSNEIAQQVEMIARMAEENGQAVGSNHQTASRLRDLADTLQENVSRFRT
ncbi:methyl-accepting chemotaxis protein [Pseudomonas sp. sp1636]|uniref:methyl-accepting chemotaxis protein n=1 Tax=Pseudomonas sp. sp1636 TaxID=3036707 RepID=UPI0025A602E2|nr:methyl-accepting chemotaxis protein [Pseudomonas sp. sp1636]MDM8348735.1 methyl-accepting chemotaxis protein [Pseudomonas sp. sp1636]